MTEHNLDQELIEQDELSNAFQVILKSQDSPKPLTRKKPTSLPLRTSLNTKLYRHSSSSDCIKVKRTDISKCRNNHSLKVSSSSSYNESVHLDNKEIEECKDEHKLKEDLKNLSGINIIDDDSSPSDYLTPAAANYYPLGSQQSGVCNQSPQFKMDSSTNESGLNTASNRNDLDDNTIENTSSHISRMDITDSACEILKDDIYASRQGESTSKEEKERLNEEIAVQSSSLSSETGSWEQVFPSKVNPEIDQICSIFIQNEQIHPQTCNTVKTIEQNTSKCSAYFIDAKSLTDDTELHLSYGSGIANISINSSTKTSTLRDSESDSSNEDSLELEVRNTRKQINDSYEGLNTQFPMEVAAPSMVQQSAVFKTFDSSLHNLGKTSHPKAKRKLKFDECSPIVSGGVSVDDYASGASPLCVSLPVSLEQSLNSSHQNKDKIISSSLTNNDNLDHKYNASNSSIQGLHSNDNDAKKPLGFFVDFSQVESVVNSAQNSSSYPASEKKIFSMFIDISSNKSLKEMPISLSSSLGKNVNNKTGKEKQLVNAKKDSGKIIQGSLTEVKAVKSSADRQESVKSSADRHSWNLGSCSFEGGIQRVLYETRKSASLSHCNLKDLSKDTSKKESNYSLSDISLGDQSYSRSDDSKTTDDTKNQETGNDQNKVQRKRKSEAKINETFDKSSTCSDKFTLTQDSTPTVTEQEELTYHPEENKSSTNDELMTSNITDRKYVKLSDLDQMSMNEDGDIPAPAMTISVPMPSMKNYNIMFQSLHVENLDKLARLFPEIKKELSRSSPDSMTLSLLSESSRKSKVDSSETNDYTLSSDLEYVFLHGIGADVNIIVDSRIIQAHKTILVARCSYFAAMLAGDDLNDISIDNFEYSVVHFALLHIYTGIRTIPGTINIFLLAALADKWNLLDLKDIVSKILFTEVCHSLHQPCPSCTSNALRCLTISNDYNMDVLFKSILVWTGKHFEKIWLTDDFCKLPQHLMERSVHWVTSSIRVNNLTDILHKCEFIQTTVTEVPKTITSFIDLVINECANYISANLPSILGDKSTVRLLYPPYKNENLLEVVLFKGAQNTSPEKLCVAIKHAQNLTLLDVPDDCSFKKVLYRLLPHLEGTIIAKIYSMERITDTSGWKELDLSTQERIKYFFRLIKKPAVTVPQSSRSNQSTPLLLHDHDLSRPVSQSKETSHIPVLAKDLEHVSVSQSTPRPLRQIQAHNMFDVKKPINKAIVKLKSDQLSARQNFTREKFSQQKKQASVSSLNEAKEGKKISKNYEHTRSHPNLSQKCTLNPKQKACASKTNKIDAHKSHPNSSQKYVPNPKLLANASEKPTSKISSLSEMSQTSQSSRITNTKCPQNLFHNVIGKGKVAAKTVISNKPAVKNINKPSTQINKNVEPVKKGLVKKFGLVNKSIPVPINQLASQARALSRQRVERNNKPIPAPSDTCENKDLRRKARRSLLNEFNEAKANEESASNCHADNEDVNDIPIMERSGTFLKDSPTVLEISDSPTALEINDSPTVLGISDSPTVLEISDSSSN